MCPWCDLLHVSDAMFHHGYGRFEVGAEGCGRGATADLRPLGPLEQGETRGTTRRGGNAVLLVVHGWDRTTVSNFFSPHVFVASDCGGVLPLCSLVFWLLTCEKVACSAIRITDINGKFPTFFVHYWNAVLLLCCSCFPCAFFNIYIGPSVYAGGNPCYNIGMAD